jgi:hypothetical protein
MTLRSDIVISCSVGTTGPQTAEAGSAPAAICGAAAGGQVGRIDKTMQPQMRRLIRKSVIFFENIDFNHCP